MGVAATSYPAALFPSWYVAPTYSDEVRQPAPNDDNHPGETTIVLAPPTPPEVQAATLRVQEQGGSLTAAEMRAVLTEAGWPAELHDAALRTSYGESRWSPGASGDAGNSLGLFQLNGATWARYCGISASSLFDALTNASCAYQVYLYDLSRGQRPWQQWSVRWELIVLP